MLRGCGCQPHIETCNPNCWQLSAIKAEADGGLIVTDADAKHSPVTLKIRQNVGAPADGYSVRDGAVRRQGSSGLRGLMMADRVYTQDKLSECRSTTVIRCKI